MICVLPLQKTSDWQFSGHSLAGASHGKKDSVQVSDEAADDPIALKDVRIPEQAMAELEACWAAPGQGSALRRALYKDSNEWVKLVKEVLRLDIRSLHQRTGAGRPQQDPSSAGQPSSQHHLGSQKDMRSYTRDSMSSAETHGCSVRPRGVVPSLSDQRAEYADSWPVRYRVVLQGMTVAYDVLSDSTVMVRGATVS